MKNLKEFLLVVFLIVFAVSFNAVADDEPEGTKVDGGMLYGQAIAEGKEVVEYVTLVEAKEKYDGMEIILSGEIKDVCQKAGCWFTFGEGKNSIRVMTKHEFFIPKNSGGKTASVEGVFKVTEISQETAEHYNEESTAPVDASEIEGPQKALIFEATGIVIQD